MDIETAKKELSMEKNNTVSSKDISLIKIKLGKSHRKESDWTLIKDILTDHNMIVVEPSEPDSYIGVIEHIACRDGVLYVFTNLDDCIEYVKRVNYEDGRIERNFVFGTLPFRSCVEISKEHNIPMHIDCTLEPNVRCMIYMPEQEEIKAVILQRFYR